MEMKNTCSFRLLIVFQASDFLTFMHGQLEHGDGRELIVVVDPKVTSDNQLWI
jgi:hypothetical protein